VLRGLVSRMSARSAVTSPVAQTRALAVQLGFLSAIIATLRLSFVPSLGVARQSKCNSSQDIRQGPSSKHWNTFWILTSDALNL